MVSVRTDLLWGSGVVVRENGVILTALHLVEDATDITVGFSDGTEAQARLLGEDLGLDLAVIKVPRSGLSPVQLADRDELRIGQAVSTLGYSEDYLALSTGIISAFVEPYRIDGERIQVTADINPGDSGAPIITAAGELAGIVVAAHFDLSGVGFASPLGDRLIARMAEGERICQPWPPLLEATTFAHPDGWFADLPQGFEHISGTNRVGRERQPWTWVFVSELQLPSYSSADEVVDGVTVPDWTYTPLTSSRVVCHPSGFDAWEFEFVVEGESGSFYYERKLVMRTDRSWYLLTGRSDNGFDVEQEVDTVLYSFRFSR